MLTGLPILNPNSLKLFFSGSAVWRNQRARERKPGVGTSVQTNGRDLGSDVTFREYLATPWTWSSSQLSTVSTVKFLSKLNSKHPEHSSLISRHS